MVKKIIYAFISIILLLRLTTATQVSADAMADYGILDVKNHTITGLAHAVGDGTTDDTAAIRAVTRYAFENRYVVVFPAGTYRVTDQIELVDDKNVGYTQRSSFRIYGSTAGARPTIILDTNSPGFNDPNNPKPIFYFWRKCGVGESCVARGTPDNPANNFHSGIRNIHIIVRAGNSGAVGIFHDAHQRSYIEDVSMDLTASGFAGINSTPGMGGTVTSNIEVTGGKYGLYLNVSTNRPTLTNITLTNQEIAAVFVKSAWDVTIAGFKITKASAPAVQIDYGNNYGSAINMVDGTIEFLSSSAQPAVTNSTGSNVTLYNVFFKNAAQLIQSGSRPAIVGNATGWSRLLEYYVPSQDPNSATIINGVVSTAKTEISSQQNATAPTEDLRLFHTWNRTQYSPDHMVSLSSQAGSGVCNALNPSDTYNIQANVAYNNQPELQRMINSSACTTIFIPKGDYYMGATLTLGENTQMIGLGTSLTWLSATDILANSSARASGWLPTSQTDFITTVNSATATTWLSDVRIAAPSNPDAHDWFTALHWKAGRNSIIKNVDPKLLRSTTYGRKPKPDVKFSGNGGGKWFGAMSAANPDNSPDPGHRRLLIENTQEPLNLYNLNLEDGASAWQGEIINSQNITVYGSKFENYKTLRIANSRNIMYFGATRSIEHQIDNTNDIQLTGLKDGHSITENYNGATINFALTTSLALLKRGTPVRIQIPASTPTPTPTGGPSCASKPQGDADCKVDGTGKAITITDFEIWRKEYFAGCSSTNLTATACQTDDDGIGTLMDANFDTDTSVTIADFEIWRKGYFGINPTGNPTSTPTATSTPVPTGQLTPTATPVPTSPPGAQEIVVMNRTNLQFTQQDNGFLTLKDPNTTLPTPPGYPAIPPNWLTPVNYFNGEWHFRYEILNHPSNTQGYLQMCIWNMPGNYPENCAPKIKYSQTGTFTAMGIPANSGNQNGWYKKNGVPVNFSDQTPMRMRIVLRGSTDCNVTQHNVANGCWNEWPNFQNMKFKLTVVMVPFGKTFSGWQNYP